MIEYAITGIIMIATAILFYIKGRMDQKKEQVEIVSNYIGAKK